MIRLAINIMRTELAIKTQKAKMKMMKHHEYFDENDSGDTETNKASATPQNITRYWDHRCYKFFEFKANENHKWTKE